MRRWRGFTLIEMVVVLTVLAVLATLAVPTWRAVSGGVADRAVLTELSGFGKAAWADVLGKAQVVFTDAGSAGAVLPDGYTLAGGDGTAPSTSRTEVSALVEWDGATVHLAARSDTGRCAVVSIHQGNQVYAEALDGVTDCEAGLAPAVNTAPPLPPTPTSIVVTATGGPASIDLSWTRVDAATGYTISCAAAGHATVTDTATNPGLGDPALSLTALDPATTYTCTVTGTPGGVSVAGTGTATTLVPPPVVVTATGGAGQAVLSWTRVDAATGYTFSCAAAGHATVTGTATNPGSGDPGSTVTGLDPGTTYSCTVTPAPAWSASAGSATVTTAPGPVTGLTVTSVTHDTLTVAWTPPPGATAFNLVLNGTPAGSTGASAHTFTGLAGGTTYVVEVVASNAGGDAAAVSVSALTAPAAPGGPTLGLITYSTVDLSWTAPAGTVAGYRVYVDGTQVATTAGTTMVLSGLTANTPYTVEVAAYNATGTGPKSAVSVTTSLDAPTALAATSPGPTQLTLTWAAPLGTVTGYKLYRDGTYVASTASLSYTFTGLSGGTGYTLAVRAFNGSGDGRSASLAALTVPAAPSGPTVTGITYSTVAVSWTAPAGTVTGYQVLLNGTPVTTTAGTSYAFTGLTANTAYTVEVAAYNATGTGPKSAVSVTTSLDAPTALAATSPGPTQLTLTWAAPLGTVTGYKLYRDGTYVASTTSLSYTFAGLSGGTGYTLAVLGYNASGDGRSASLAALTVPAAPTALNVSAVGTTTATLGWTAPGGTVTGYQAYRDGVLVASTALTGYTFTGLTPGTAYTLGVRAYNAAGSSTTASAAANTPPNTPAAPTFTAVTATSVTVNWVAVAGAATYTVLVNGSPVASGLAGVAHNVTGLTGSTTYTVSVRAVASHGGVATSTGANVTTMSACIAGSANYAASTTAQTFTMPAGCTTLTVTLAGGAGNDLYYPFTVWANGGAGGYVRASIPTTGGTVWTFNVGRRGAARAGSYGNYRWGGEGTYVWQGSTLWAVAGGGGSAGYKNNVGAILQVNSNGGAGGGANSPGGAGGTFSGTLPGVTGIVTVTGGAGGTLGAGGASGAVGGAAAVHPSYGTAAPGNCATIAGTGTFNGSQGYVSGGYWGGGSGYCGGGPGVVAQAWDNNWSAWAEGGSGGGGGSGYLRAGATLLGSADGSNAGADGYLTAAWS